MPWSGHQRHAIKKFDLCEALPPKILDFDEKKQKKVELVFETPIQAGRNILWREDWSVPPIQQPEQRAS
jgi:hypothetical protein